MSLSIRDTALISEYAAMHGIPFSAAVGVFCLIGSAGLLRILVRNPRI